MIDSLLSMHGIKYIISVDDCYSAPKQAEMMAKIFSEMCDSIEPFKEYLISIGKNSTLAEIEDLSDFGSGSDALISNLLDKTSEEELAGLFSIANKKEPYLNERTGILSFLSGLKEKGYIERYLTFSSTSEAVSLDSNAEGMVDGGILWLLDRDFERVGESPEAGLQLAQTIVERRSAQNNYVYILSAVEPDSEISEDDIELEFDRMLLSNCDPKISSFVYYINKQRVLSNSEKKIAKSLAQGFKRKVCYELFRIYGKCLNESMKTSSEIIFGIKQKTLNYLFAQKVDGMGESRLDFISRFVQIFQSNEYNKELAANHALIASRMNYYEELCDKVKDNVGNSNEMTPILKKFREIELYNGHINAQHLEITAGDIFKIENSYYLLVSQACDTYLRNDGCRKLKYANLLAIGQNGTSNNGYKLSCFMGFIEATVIYQDQLTIPFDILDLCVINDDGQACIDSCYIQDNDMFNLGGYTKNFAHRLQAVIRHIKLIFENQSLLELYIEKEAEISRERAKMAYNMLIDEEPFMKKYKVENDKFQYPVQRVCRLDELITIDIIKQYGTTLSRIGHPFDYL